MGVSLPLLHSLDLKGILQGNHEDDSKLSSGSLWNKVLEAKAKRRRQLLVRKQRRLLLRKNGGQIRCRRPRRILMKRRESVEGSRRASNEIESRVRTLKNLVPNSDSSMGLDGLFRETADYILALQMKVKVMQDMVKVLTGSDE